MTTTNENALAETVAYTAIRRTQDRYADIVTRRAWSELAEIIRPDCRITVDLLDRAIHFNGPIEIGNFISGQLAQFDFFEFVILNTVMKIDTDVGRAGARMYMQEARQDIATGRRFDTFGVYHDRFERDNKGCWWFARRHYRSYARTNPADHEQEMVVFEIPELDLSELAAGGLD